MFCQCLSLLLGEFSYYVCLCCFGIGIVCDNELLLFFILCLIEEEVLKENIQEVYVIVFVLIVFYLLNEKCFVVNVIEICQDGVCCVIVLNDQMEILYYYVLCVCKGEEILILSYMLLKLYEEVMVLLFEEEFVECKCLE